MAQAIVFYISGHGFGHASRSIEVINAILAQRPETRVGVRTSAPRWLFDLTVKGKVTYSTLECDTGVVQSDALTLDEADSIRRAAAFHSDLVTRAASETRSLRELGAGLIVGDIPPLAFAVGASAGIPRSGWATSPGTGSTPTTLASASRRRCCQRSAAPTPRRRWRCGCRCPVDSRASPTSATSPSSRDTRIGSREEVCKLLKIPGRQADRAVLVRRLRTARHRYRRPGEVEEVHGPGDGDGAARPRQEGHAGRRTEGLPRHDQRGGDVQPSASATRISSAPPRRS